MDYQDIVGQSMTTTGGGSSNTYIYPSDYTYPSGTLAYYGYWPSEPTTCIGKAHVFECEHVKACKCGAVERVMGKSKSGKGSKSGKRYGC